MVRKWSTVPISLSYTTPRRHRARLRELERQRQQVRFCRYRFSLPGEKGRGRVRIQVHCGCELSFGGTELRLLSLNLYKNQIKIILQIIALNRQGGNRPAGGAGARDADHGARAAAAASAAEKTKTKPGERDFDYLRLAVQRDQGRIVTEGISGGGSLTGAVSRRPPISLDTMVPRTGGYGTRTGGYTYDDGVWDLSIVQGPVSVRAAPNLNVSIRQTVASLYKSIAELMYKYQSNR
jgi:hypothetical protein